MFKIISNVGEWGDIYVSKHASDSLRNSNPPSPEFRGERNGIHFSELYSKKSSQGRPKLVLLLTESSSSALPLSIFNSLSQRSGGDLRELTEVDSRQDAKATIGRIRRACEDTDELLSPVGPSDTTNKPPSQLALWLCCATALAALLGSAIVFFTRPIPTDARLLARSEAERLVSAAHTEFKTELQNSLKDSNEARESLSYELDKLEKEVDSLDSLLSELKSKRPPAQDLEVLQNLNKRLKDIEGLLEDESER